MEVSASKAREEFGTLVDRAHYNGERIIVTKNGKPFAALVPIEDLEQLRALEDEIDAEASRKALADPRRYSLDEVMASVRARGADDETTED
jgi:prevent-host-death family protein